MTHNHKCKTCAFAVRDGENYECRRYPPTANLFQIPAPKGQTGWQKMSVYPPIDPDHWCGEFKPSLDLSIQ